MKKIGVFIEMKNGNIKPAVLGVLTAAQGKDHEIYALLIDRMAADHKERLQAFGVHKIVDITINEGRTDWNPDIWTRAIQQAVAQLELTYLLGLSSAIGRELLPRLAAELDAPLVMDCTHVNLADKTAITSQYSGKTIATVKVNGAHMLFGIRPNVVAPLSKPEVAQILSVNTQVDTNRLRVKKLQHVSGSSVALSEADIIISGGRAMKNPDNFRLLFECAEVLGAAVGASRAAVDAGWVPHAMQVGQTGTTVNPKLYIACGISGSIQHFAGMKTAKVIVAINTDPDAPMVKHSDYAIIGDLFEIIPMLSQQLHIRKK